MPIHDYLEQTDRPASLEERVEAMYLLAKSERLTTNFLIYGLMSALGDEGRAAVEEAARQLGKANVDGDLEREAKDTAAQVLRQIALALDTNSPAALQ